MKQSNDFYFHRIDSTEDDGSYARLLNDDHVSPNLQAKLIKVKRDYLPCFFTFRNIDIGEELVYDYGGDDYPWRKVGL